MENWLNIKTEYITTDTSYRKLAEKYGLSTGSIKFVGAREQWPALRQKYREETMAKAIGQIREAQVRQAAKAGDLADKLLLKLEQAIDELDLKVTKYKIKTEEGNQEQTAEYRTAEPGGIVDRAGLRQLTAALQALQVVKGDLTDLERREKEARIEYLRQKARPEAQEAPALIVEGLPEEFKR